MVVMNFKYLLLLSLITEIKGVDSGINNVTAALTNEEHIPRQNNKRQVKLYSGVRPTPIVCRGEGFQEDPIDCMMFHRCVKSGKGRFVSFRFQCSPGTIFDPDNKICNHPDKTRRVNCGGKINESSRQFNDNEINQELPIPISTKEPFYAERNKHKNSPIMKKTSLPELSKKWDSSNKENVENIINPFLSSEAIPQVLKIGNYNITKIPSINLKSTTLRSVSFNDEHINARSAEICTSDGFMGDSENCRKFYRCIGNQRGGFIKYEFLCSEPTIWDEDKKACNHVWNVKRRRCGRGNVFESDNKNYVDANMFNVNKNHVSPKNVSSATQTQSQINYGSTVTQTQTQISNGTVNQNQTQINYENGSNSKQNQTQISYGTAVSQIQSQMNFGNKITQTQLQIDHLNDSSQLQNQVSQPSTTVASTHNSEDISSTTKQTPNSGCAKSGFIGDSNDCKKFYRCVDNGKGSYTRYEFSCGEGTVWDPNLESCNHAWAVKECGGKGSSLTTSDQTTVTVQSSIAASSKPITESSTQMHISEEPATEEENEISYGNQQSSSTTNKPISSIPPVSTQPINDNQCRSSGFIGDNNDCKKFYRCVDNGSGQFTRYEFSCGEGTVWDSRVEACNHVWAVEKCGGSENSDIQKEETMTTKTTISPQILEQNDDFNNGYGPQNDDSISETTITLTSTTTRATTTITTTVSQSQNNNNENECKTSGFMGDSKDCKKFYRCVDNGNGSYTKYEFSCGEGTVWEPKNQVCNHDWAVKKCGGNTEIETTSHKEFENTTTVTTSTTISLVTEDEDDGGYDQQNNVTPSSSTTSSNNQNIGNLCTSDGFVGDKNDCKKFYRCVDDGSGGFTKYEFTCGEGTVWDPEINACNHAWAVTKCGNSVTERPITTTQIYPIEQENQGEYPAQNDEYIEKPEQSTAISISTTSVSNTAAKNKCHTSGFMGDNNDCKKFYRCVENGKGDYIQYEFSCGEGTVWDQTIESCNHEWAVRDCKQSNNFNNTNNVESIFTEGTTEAEDHGYNNQQSSEASFISTSTTIKPTGGVCRQEGFYGDENDCKKFYRCVDNGQGGYTKYDFTCGEGTAWNQEISTCDHEFSHKTCKFNESSTTTKKSTIENDELHSEITTEHTSTTSGENYSKPGQSSEDLCKTDGFYSDLNNCKKFYRCVNNGKGGFIKYDFTCGEGTIWVQEIQACDHDNGVTSCTSKDTTPKPKPTDQNESSSQNTIQVQGENEENGEVSNESSTKPSSTQCTSEGFYGNENDCTKFYRCVDNGQGGFIKYDFTCGEGTAWDSNVGTCNHISEVNNCKNPIHLENQMMYDETSQTTASTSTTTESGSEDNIDPDGNVCTEEGYFGNTKDCTKFYRCVDNGKGGLTKYDFDCGEGTIWDQDLTTCNHPQDVTNPSCKNSIEGSASTSSSNAGTQTTTEKQNTSCSHENSSKKPESQKMKCEKAGYYANPDDCKKFYRCVDWDGNGEKFSIFHFECGEGTIWDPQLDTCNHEDSVYPPRDCSGSQNQGESITQENTTTQIQQSTTSSSSEMTTTTEKSTQSSTNEATTEEFTTTSQSPTEEIITTQRTTTESTTTSSETTTQSNNDQSTTQKITTTAQTTPALTTSEQTTQSSPPSEEPTTPQTTTSVLTTTQQSTTVEQTTTEQASTSEQTIPEQSTTEQSTTEQTTTEQSTTEKSTTEQSTTEQSTTEQATTESTTTKQSQDSDNTTIQENITEQQTTTSEPATSVTTQTEQTTTEQQNMDNQSTTTESYDSTTTESDQGTTTEKISDDKECPDTDDDQYLYVCPTSFKRHPKYCNMFYQCTEDDDNHEMKIATFTCPNNTIYDESKVQCVEENKADKKCDGQKARKFRVKRLNSYKKDPIQVDSEQHTCTTIGNHPFEKRNECSSVFLKCVQAKSGKLRGFVYQCPESHVYWSISKRCEKREHMKYCQESSRRNWSERWEIPVERKNIAK